MLALKGYRMSLMARELYPDECSTPKGLYNAQKRIKYHIGELVNAKHLRAQRSPKGRMIGFERGREYRQFEQLYIAEGVAPNISPRVGSPTLPLEIHHIRGYMVVSEPPLKALSYCYDKPHSGVPHRIANFHKQPQHHPDTEIPDYLPDFKVLYRAGKYKQSFSIYITEPLDVKDRRTLIEHEELIEQSLYSIRTWLCKQYHVKLGLPEIQHPTHYAFPVPRGVAEALKRITDPNESLLYGDTSKGRAHAELHDAVTAGELALLPETLNDVRRELRAIREDNQKDVGRIDELELTIKEMHLTIKDIASKQTRLVKMLSSEETEEDKPDPPKYTDDGWRMYL